MLYVERRSFIGGDTGVVSYTERDHLNDPDRPGRELQYRKGLLTGCGTGTRSRTLLKSGIIIKTGGFLRVLKL